MDAEQILRIVAEHGGCAGWTELAGASPRVVRRLVASGELVRDAPGRFALPTAPEWLRAARRLGGIASHLSAAHAYGWPLAVAPTRPQVTVPSEARRRARGAELHWGPIGASELRLGLTAPARTVLDCARTCSFPHGLAVADSALRQGGVGAEELLAESAHLRGPGSRRARRVAELADGAAANPFESALRAIASTVPQLRLRSQVVIHTSTGLTARVDLADVRLRIVVEADSAEFHGTREAFYQDVHRYTALSLDGWLVLRFTWHEVFRRPETVHAALAAAALRRQDERVPARQHR